jgi:hypothetical protein
MYTFNFFNLGDRYGWVVNATTRPFYPWERPGTHRTGGWAAPRPGLNTGEKNYIYLPSLRMKVPDHVCLWKLAVVVATYVSICIVYRILPSFAF